MSEDKNAPKPRPPVAVDPVDQSLITPEWLEQAIHNIHPRIEGVVIQSIRLNSSPPHVVYVVDIPQSSTAHMAADHCYYKRFNFSSVPMEDHEVRDVMARGRNPQVELSFRVRSTTLLGVRTVRLRIEARNSGAIYAQYVKCTLFLPPTLARHRFTALRHEMETIEGIDYFVVEEINREQDVFVSKDGQEQFGTSWFDPILPGKRYSWSWKLPYGLMPSDLKSSDEMIRWEVAADHASIRRGVIKLCDLTFESKQIGIGALISTFVAENRLAILLMLFMVVVLVFTFSLALRH